MKLKALLFHNFMRHYLLYFSKLNINYSAPFFDKEEAFDFVSQIIKYTTHVNQNYFFDPETKKTKQHLPMKKYFTSRLLNNAEQTDQTKQLND